jgi:hypothetical protein
MSEAVVRGIMQACKYITETLAISTTELGNDALINCAKTSMSSKIIGAESDFFAALAVNAMQSVKTTMPDGTVRSPCPSASDVFDRLAMVLVDGGLPTPSWLHYRLSTQ